MSSFYNRVKFAATTTGTTDFGVGSAATGFQTPSGASVPNNQPISYAAFSSSGSEWETGQGLYVSAGPTITRVTVFDSSAGFGTKQSFTASPTVQLDVLGQDLISTVGPSSLTGSQTTPLLSMAQTWNTTGAATGILLNITDTAASNSSKFLDIQSSGASVFSVLKNSSRGGTGFLVRAETPNSQTFEVTPRDGSTGGTSISNGGAPFSFEGPLVGINQITTGFVGAASSFGSNPDLILSRIAAATLQFGATDAASPVAQTTQVQSVVAGTSNTAGVDWTHSGSAGTGTGAGGKLVFRTAPAGTTGTSQNALATGLTITAPAVSMQPSVVIGNQALATTATDGFLYIPTCAGPPTGVPTTQTGRVAMIYDTTNNKFYIYNGAWKGGTAPGTFT